MAEQAEAVEQPQEGSIDVGQLIADKFAGPDEQPEEAAEVEAQEQPQEETPEESEAETETSEESSGFVEVEFGGETYQVPPQMKDALMAQSDYTQKTQQLSQQRETVELQQKEVTLQIEQQQFVNSVQEEVDQIKMLDAYITHVQHNTNWAGLSTDDAFRAKMELDNLKDQKTALEQQVQTRHQEFQTNLEGKRAALRQEIDSSLSKSIQGWNEQVRTDVQEYVKQAGYPAMALENMSALDFQIAHKAMQFDQLKTKTAKAVEKASAAPSIKPKSRNEMPKAVQNKLNYRKAVSKAKSPRDAEKLAQERIADIFNG